MSKQPTRITVWHTMADVPGVKGRAFGEHLAGTVEAFNKGQSEYEVSAVHKGGYEEVLKAGMEAFHAGHPPHILQVPEAGTAMMMAARDMTRPAAEVMREAGEPWDPGSYMPIVADYYTAPDGQLQSFPFNISTAILYYNKDAFERAGLDPDKAPATWPELAEASARLKAGGMRHGYTTSRHIWVHLENFSAWHDLEFATRGNGFDGTDARLCFNSPLHVRHIQNLADWDRQGLFTYVGRGVEAESLFINGGCAMITTASSPYAGIVMDARFEVGVAPLPYYADVPGAPRNTTIGGSSFWVMNGKTRKEYEGVARFMAFISRPEEQARRHREVGYLPVSTAAYTLTGDPAVNVTLQQLNASKLTPRSRGIRLGHSMLLRRIIDDEVEGVWFGKHDARTALDRAVQRGNELLDELQKAPERRDGRPPEALLRAVDRR